MNDHPPPSRRLLRPTRRQFIGGTLAAGLLAACGDDDSGSSDTSAATSSAGDPDLQAPPTGSEPWTIVQRFPQNTQVPGEIRLPFSLSTGEASFITDGPIELGATVTDLDGNPIGGPVRALRRDVDPAPYYSFRPTIEEPGIYRIVIKGGPEEGAAFDVAEPEAVQVPIPGDTLEPFDTPTTDAPGGVDPICTRDPMCSLHSITLTEALASGRSVAYLVGTPAFCSTGTCGPGLDALLALQEEYADRFEFVHAEVYTDTTATTPAPAVVQLGLFYEPALFVADATGTIVDRLDAIWDESELRETLDRV
jgi:hypothetical protein